MTTIRVCNCGEISGAFTTLQPAISAARYGDIIALHHKDTFDAPGKWDTFNLGNKGTPPTGTDADYITITTDDPTGTPAALSGYPKHDVRITSAMAARMPTVRAVSSFPVFWVNKNAKYWKVERLNITTAPGASAIRLIGLGEDPPNTPQEYPDHIIFQLNWIHPHEEVGEPLSQATIFRSAESAFYLEGTNIWIHHNAMQGFVCKYREGGQPPHTCLLMTTWADNVLVENNLMEAWTYTFFFGGGSKGLATKTATVSNVTPTSATFSNTNGLVAGMAVAVLVYEYTDSGGTLREVWGSAIVKSINGSTVTYEAALCNSNNTDGNGNTCMPFDANNLRQLPVDGAQARWDGLQVQNVTVRRNIIAHRPEWTLLMDNNCGGKGYLELKSGQNITVDGNVFKGCTGPTITARNQGGPDPWNDLDNLKLTNNYFMNANSPFTAYLNDGGNLTNKSRNVTYHNNLVVGQYSNPDDYRWITVIAGVFTGGKNTRVTHNTVLVGAYRNFSSYADARNQMDGLQMSDNIFRAAPNACYTDGRGIAGAPVTDCWPGARVVKNVLVKVDDLYPDGDIAENWTKHFPDNKLIHGIESVGFVKPSATLDASGNYRIREDSPLKNTASDGTDPGVNYPQLIAALGFDPNDPAVEVPPAPPVPAPTPSPPPVPQPPAPPVPPTTSSGMIRVVGRALQDETSIVGVRVTLQGMESISREGDALFWFDTLVPVGSVITGSKEGWVFEPLTVKEDVPLYGLQGKPVAAPPVPVPPVPPEPPVPAPVPAPTPAPAPVPPTPCGISAPASVTIRKNSTGTIAVTLNDLSGPTEVKVVGSDGQVTVSPLTWTADATSSVKQFSIRVKKQSRTIRFESPCGVAVVRVNVI